MASQPARVHFEYAGMGNAASLLSDVGSKRAERTALDLLESGRLNTQPMMGKAFRYEEAVQAYQFIDQHPEASLKTILYYDGTV